METMKTFPDIIESIFHFPDSGPLEAKEKKEYLIDYTSINDMANRYNGLEVQEVQKSKGVKLCDKDERDFLFSLDSFNWKMAYFRADDEIYGFLTAMQMRFLGQFSTFLIDYNFQENEVAHVEGVSGFLDEKNDILTDLQRRLLLRYL